MKIYLKLLLTVSAVVLFVGTFSFSANAQLLGNNSAASRGDVRVQRVLDALNLRYEVQNSGSFKLVPINMGNRRTQLVYVDSKTDRFGSLEIREVWAPAAATRGELPQTVANKLLREKPKFGSWRIYFDGTNSLVYFAAHISADADSSTMRTTIDFVTKVADEMEIELTGKDDF